MKMQLRCICTEPSLQNQVESFGGRLGTEHDDLLQARAPERMDTQDMMKVMRRNE